MAALVTCNFDEDRIKTEGTIDQQSNMGFFCHSRASNSEEDTLIWPEFELIQDFMAVLVSGKNDEDPIKSEVAIDQTTFSPL